VGVSLCQNMISTYMYRYICINVYIYVYIFINL